MMSKATSEKQIMDKLYETLTNGDIKSSLETYESYTRIFNDSNFIDKILKPVIGRIEDELVRKKISIATGHVANNVATTLANIITDMRDKK